MKNIKNYKITRMRLFTIIAFIVLNISLTFAQSSKRNPMKWGDIPKEDFKMKSYAQDPEAEAVILGEYGELEYFIEESFFKYRLTIHRRVKILKEAAIDRYSNFGVSYYIGSAGLDDKVKNIKAQSFSSKGERQSISRSNIFTEKESDRFETKKVTIPNVKVGSIIEYKYTLETFNTQYIPTWYFQKGDPVRISRYRLNIMSEYQFVSHFNAKVVSKGEGVYLYQGQSKLTIVDGNIYTMENLKAVAGEQYITSINDYRASISFYLESSSTGGTKEVYLGTWDNFAKKQRESNSFGKQYLKKPNYNKMLEAASSIVNNSSLSKKEKTQALYDFINDKMKWSGRYATWVGGKNIDDLDDAFATGEADSGELNLMLLALLREAKIKANPVMISTRRHGQTNETYPLDDQFNHILVHVELEGEKMLLDTRSKLRPLGYPDYNSLNKRGWLLRDNSHEWIDITAKKGADIFLVNAELKTDGSMEGSLKGVYQGYNALPERRAFKKNKSGKHWQDRLGEKYPNISISEVKFENLEDLTQDFKDELNWTITEAAQVAGDLMYLSPALYSTYSENPLKQEERSYPVDYTYPFREQLIVNMKLPEGYVVDELPESVNISLPNKGGKFQYFIKEKDGGLQLVSKVSINQTVFQPVEYAGLKKFFDLVVEKHEEQLVLKKAK